MPKAIISDTSCLILLDKIDELDLLQKLFGSIITTSVVANEFELELPEWIKIIDPVDFHYLSIIEQTLGKGEASAIALATELKDCLLILDDLKARKFAHELGLTITGTLGVIVDAKLAGIIQSVKPIIDKIGHTDFRITNAIEKKILEKAGE